MTYKEAFIQGWQANLAITMNLARDINKFVKSFTWLVILSVIFVSAGSCYYNIAQARAERDSLSVSNYHLQQSLDSLRLMKR